MQLRQRRRGFLTSASLAAAAGVFGTRASIAAAEPPETTTIRLAYDPSICIAPSYISDALLRAEGFTDVQHIQSLADDAVANGEIDFAIDTAAWIVAQVDAGKPIMALAGLHPGCYEMFANDPVRNVGDLRGKKVGINYMGGGGHLLLSIMAAQVGLDPHNDIEWITADTATPMQMFADGEVDAFLGFPPEPQELRARRIGRPILNMLEDKPWSQYFCCVAFGNRSFVRDRPIATKRYLRALYKAAELCATQPAWAAQVLVDAGFTDQYDYALETLTELPYASWREFDAEDSMRFYGLRLHELGMIRSTPQEILAAGTDWRFLNELKRELKT